MFRPPNIIWALIFFCVALALPLPPAPQSHAEADGAPLQVEAPPEEMAKERIGGQGDDAEIEQIDEAALEARVLARLRHRMHGEVEDLAMRSMEQAMRRLRDRDGSNPARPLAKGLRLTFSFEPEVKGIAPVSVVTRTSSYSAFADTVLGGTAFRLNVVGDVSLKGLHQDRVAVEFSTLLQFENAGNEESGSSGARGSAELGIGQPEILMSVGARDLVLTVSEVGLP